MQTAKLAAVAAVLVPQAVMALATYLLELPAMVGKDCSPP
jgi:hypothetical protein